MPPKTCSSCSQEKQDEEFNWRIQNVTRARQCKSCHSAYRKRHYRENRQKYIDKAREWERNNGGKLQQKHGISEAEFELLKGKFNGLCWVCKEKAATHIDHDHLCCPKGKSCSSCRRGVLCNNCNAGLGFLQDRIEIVYNAYEYLKHQKTVVSREASKTSA